MGRQKVLSKAQEVGFCVTEEVVTLHVTPNLEATGCCAEFKFTVWHFLVAYLYLFLSFDRYFYLHPMYAL